MGVPSKPAALDHSAPSKPCKPAAIPEVDISDPNAKYHIVKACEESGFFKVISHGVPMELMACFENQVLHFFHLPSSEKDKARTPHPLSYASNNIGSNGDQGCLEYLLLNTNPLLFSPENVKIFRLDVECYVREMRKIGCAVVELITEGLGIEPRNVISRLLSDEKSDSCLRLNYYSRDIQALSGRSDLIGFGEHTDPQIITVLRSNNSTGLQICLKNGEWLSVPPDPSSFFILVGDVLQVMTNKRFKSVRHRVVAHTNEERLSMIYFGGPPPSEKIAPLPSLLADGEESSYKEFTWWEYMNAAKKTKLADDRLAAFEK